MNQASNVIIDIFYDISEPDPLMEILIVMEVYPLSKRD
jgi:hypothetical protein